MAESTWYEDRKKPKPKGGLQPFKCEKCGARLMDVDIDTLKLALSKLPMYYKGRDIVEIQCYKRDCKHHNKIKV